MLFFLKFFSFYCLLFRNFKLLFQVFYFILKLLHIFFYFLVFNNLKLFLLLIFNVLQKFELFLEFFNCLIFHFNFILKHVNSGINDEITCPKNLLRFPLLLGFAEQICTFRFVCKHLKVTFLYFTTVQVVELTVRVRICYEILFFVW